MERQIALMDDPLFAAGSTRMATLSIPISPAGIACTLELFLSRDGGATKAASTGLVAFTSGQNVNVSLQMPAEEGYSYAVYIDVVVGGVVQKGYQASENVVIPSVGGVTITWA